MSYKYTVKHRQITVDFDYDASSGDLFYSVARPDGRTVASTMPVDRNYLEHGIRPTQTYLNELARRLVRQTRTVRAHA